jgi:hypothetical protein
VGTLAGSKSGGITWFTGIEVFDDIDEIACSPGSLGDRCATCGPDQSVQGRFVEGEEFQPAVSERDGGAPGQSLRT